MSQVSLQNRDSKVLKSGDYVKFAPNTRTACVFALIGDSNIIGSCAEQIYPGKWGLVNLLNTVNYNDLIDKPTSPGGSGDMVASIYDPDNIADDAFDMDNMKNGSTNKIVTDTEKLAWNDKLPSSSFSGLAKITVGTSAPVAPGVGDIWIDSTP